MPELPEVETIKRDLLKNLKNKTIKDIKIKVPKMVNFRVKKFQSLVKGAKIKNITRRAKLLIFELSNDWYLLVHLKLTGQLIYREKNGILKAVGGHPIKQDLTKLPNKFSHVVFTFSDNSHLFFNDVRKFGYAKLLKKEELDELLKKNYGPEPLSQEFSLNKFKEILKKRPNWKIKQLLLDQKLIAGIGNIYADESLFCARIDPRRIASKVKESEIKKLHACIKKILKLSIAKRGTSANNYVDAYGRQGSMVPCLKVYGSHKKPCRKCKAEISKIKLAGRGTHFCGRCQK